MRPRWPTASRPWIGQRWHGINRVPAWEARLLFLLATLGLLAGGLGGERLELLALLPAALLLLGVAKQRRLTAPSADPS